MNTLTKEQEERINNAERSDKASEETLQIVALLNIIEPRLPKGTVFDGTEARAMVRVLNNKGIELPCKPWRSVSEREQRSITAKVNNEKIGRAHV
jgi:hypothetical protein